MNRCEFCEKEFNQTRTNQKYCPACRYKAKLKRNREYKREHRKEINQYQKQYFKKQKQNHKQNIRSATLRLIKSGYLKKLPCAICGCNQTEAHHVTYEGKFCEYAVVFLCTAHHRELHRKYKRDTNENTQI